MRRQLDASEAEPPRARDPGARRRLGSAARLASPCAPRRTADGHPRHHSREHRPAAHRDRPEPERLHDQLDDHELLADLRKPASLRRPRCRSARPPADVPDRTRRLHRRVARLGDGRKRRDAVRGAGRTGRWCRDPLAGGALDHHDGLPGLEACEGARRMGSRGRSRRGDRRPRGWRPDAVRRLADDLLRQRARRGRAVRRRVAHRPAGRKRLAGEASTSRRALLATTSIAAIVFAITQADSVGWTSFQTHLCGLGGLGRPRRIRDLRAPHRHTAPPRRADRRPCRRRRPRAHARSRRLDLRALPALLALPPERAWHGIARNGARVRPTRCLCRNRRTRRGPPHRQARRARPAHRCVRGRRRRHARALPRRRERQLPPRRSSRDADRRNRARRRRGFRLRRNPDRHPRGRDRDALGPQLDRTRDRRDARHRDLLDDRRREAEPSSARTQHRESPTRSWSPPSSLRSPA